MTQKPTVTVKWSNPQGWAIINEEDYDASVHELYDDCSTDGDSQEPPESEETPVTDETEQPARKRRERKTETTE